MSVRGEDLVEVTWDPAFFPMVLIRNPESGEVLSFGRGGSLSLPALSSEVEMVFSNGIRSTEPIRRSLR